MKIFTIILTSLSTLVVLLAIIFEGKLKSQRDQPTKTEGEVNLKKWFSKLIKEFKKEIKYLSIFGWMLMIISFVLAIFNGIATFSAIEDSNNQHSEDTLRLRKLLINSHEVNTILKKKTFFDSIKIHNLEILLKENGLKSDSIRLSVVDNAVKEMEEQRKSIEKEKENAFIHFKNEVEDNLVKILFKFNENQINGFGDTLGFISTRLDNTYIKKYESVSSSSIIIDHLMETANVIDKVNYYCNSATESDILQNRYERLTSKKLHIRMLLKSITEAKEYLFSIYERIFTVDSYKLFESIKFENDKNITSRKFLESYLTVDYLKKHNMKF